MVGAIFALHRRPQETQLPNLMGDVFFSDLPEEFRCKVVCRVIWLQFSLRLVCSEFARKLVWMTELSSRRDPAKVVRGAFQLLRCIFDSGTRRLTYASFVLLNSSAFRVTCCSSGSSTSHENAIAITDAIDAVVDGALAGLSAAEKEVFAAFVAKTFQHADAIVRRKARGSTLVQVFASRGVKCPC